MTDGAWKELLMLLLSQRLEINALESALKTASILTDAQVKEIRTQASDTAKAWSSNDSDDVLALLRVHSSPLASMSVPRTGEPLLFQPLNSIDSTPCPTSLMKSSNAEGFWI